MANYDSKWFYLSEEPQTETNRLITQSFPYPLSHYVDFYDRDHRPATRQNELSWETKFKNSAIFYFRPVEDVTDALNEPFAMRPDIIIPAGKYHFNRPRVQFTSDRSKSFGFTARYKWGGFYTGRRRELSGGVTIRPNPHLLIDFSDSYNRVRLTQGDFQTNLLTGRVSYNFSRRVLTSALLQINSASRSRTSGREGARIAPQGYFPDSLFPFSVFILAVLPYFLL